jgi:hypothetical protein
MAAARRGGRPRKEEPKQPVSLCLDPTVLRHLRGKGPGWQTAVNDALADLIERPDSDKHWRSGDCAMCGRWGMCGFLPLTTPDRPMPRRWISRWDLTAKIDPEASSEESIVLFVDHVDQIEHRLGQGRADDLRPG